MRYFAAIPVPDEISHELHRLQTGVSGARWVAVETFHITLGFFDTLSDDTVEVLDDRLGRTEHSPVELALSGVGHAGSTVPYALWARVHSTHVATAQAPDPLHALNHYIKNSARHAGITLERKVFRPHVTLAYLTPQTPIDRIIAFETRHAKFATVPFLADRFCLYSSRPHKNGPNRYHKEAEYPMTRP